MFSRCVVDCVQINWCNQTTNSDWRRIIGKIIGRRRKQSVTSTKGYQKSHFDTYICVQPQIYSTIQRWVWVAKPLKAREMSVMWHSKQYALLIHSLILTQSAVSTPITIFLVEIFSLLMFSKKKNWHTNFKITSRETSDFEKENTRERERGREETDFWKVCWHAIN